MHLVHMDMQGERTEVLLQVTTAQLRRPSTAASWRQPLLHRFHLPHASAALLVSP